MRAQAEQDEQLLAHRPIGILRKQGLVVTHDALGFLDRMPCLRRLAAAFGRIPVKAQIVHAGHALTTYAHGWMAVRCHATFGAWAPRSWVALTHPAAAWA